MATTGFIECEVSTMSPDVMDRYVSLSDLRKLLAFILVMSLSDNCITTSLPLGLDVILDSSDSMLAVEFAALWNVMPETLMNSVLTGSEKYRVSVLFSIDKSK